MPEDLIKLKQLTDNKKLKDRFHCHAMTKLIENHPVEKAKKLCCYGEKLNKTLLQVLGLCVSPVSKRHVGVHP